MRLKNLIHNSPILKKANNPKIKETKTMYNCTYTVEV